jgi:predicted dehydrogenase
MTLTVAYAGLDHHHAGPYAESLAQLPAEVVCACPSTEAEGERSIPDAFGDVPVYDDPDTVLGAAGDVDLLWITLPNRDTPAVIDAAVDAGIDVFTEKPAARTAADLAPVAERVRASDVRVGVSYLWRGHPAVRDLRSRAETGFLSPVRGFEARFLASRVEHRDGSHYLFDPAASRGGILQWLAVHWIDLLPWLLDDPVVAVTGSDAGGAAVDVEDAVTLTLETESGAVGSLHAGYYLREGRYDTYLAVHGDGGRFTWDPVSGGFGFDGETTVELESGRWAGVPRRQVTYEYDRGSGYGSAWGTAYLGEFLRAFDRDEPVPVDLDDALDVLEVLDAAYAAVEEGRRVPVGADDTR